MSAKNLSLIVPILFSFACTDAAREAPATGSPSHGVTEQTGTATPSSSESSSSSEPIPGTGASSSTAGLAGSEVPPNGTTTSAPATSTASGEPEAVPPDGFRLLWEDSFDSVDTTRWAAQTHSWDGNLAQFTADNVSATDGRLKLLLSPSDSEDKPYGGVEYRSLDTITYGKVEASMRFAKGSGVVSSLVLIYTPWPPDDWNELDIECLGNTTGEVQFNHMVNIPPADPVAEHLQFPEKVDLGFDPTLDFHTYTIEWLPTRVRFMVDGIVIHEPTEEVSRLSLPQNILLTIWASDAASWAGPIDATTAPTFSEVDWLRVYSYSAP